MTTKTNGMICWILPGFQLEPPDMQKSTKNTPFELMFNRHILCCTSIYMIQFSFFLLHKSRKATLLLPQSEGKAPMPSDEELDDYDIHVEDVMT